MRNLKRTTSFLSILSALGAALFFLWGHALERSISTPPAKQEIRIPETSDREIIEQEDINSDMELSRELFQKEIHSPPSFDNVPFTPQAPFGAWSDPRQQDGCEEAASLMAVRWARNQPLSFKEAEQEIFAMAKFQDQKYGNFHDTSATDTARRIIQEYFGYQKVSVRLDIGADDIIEELHKGNLVIVPTNGRLLSNPYYTPPGPERHMLVVKGYDPKTQEFITNDNGTKRGEGYHYKREIFEAAIQDYPTGNHVPAIERRPALISIWR